MSVTQVQTIGIINDAVTADKIATGAVGTTEIADDAVTADKIATGAVGTTEIASGVTITGTLNGNASSVTNGVYTTNFTGSNQDFVGTSGYQKLPGGFTIQWGQSSPLGQQSQTQTFAIPFTSGVFAVIATPISNNPPAGDKRDHWAVSNFTSSNFTLISWFETTTVAYNWIAIGI